MRNITDNNNTGVNDHRTRRIVKHDAQVVRLYFTKGLIKLQLFKTKNRLKVTCFFSSLKYRKIN